jgi:hypothetical protein
MSLVMRTSGCPCGTPFSLLSELVILSESRYGVNFGVKKKEAYRGLYSNKCVNFHAEVSQVFHREVSHL